MLSIVSRFSGDEIVVADPDAEGLFEEPDELENAGGVDDAGFDQRTRAGQAPRVVAEEEIRSQEFADLFFHSIILSQEDDELLLGESGRCNVSGLASRALERA